MISSVIWRMPSAFSEVDSTARSRELKAERRSPLVEVAMKSKASSSSTTGKSKPRSGSSSAVFRACLTSSVVNGSSSKICTRLRIAGVTEKKGFSVVAPIMMTRPLSSNGKRKSCLVLSRRWISSKSRTRPPENLASSAISWRRFLLSTVALKVRKAYLVVPAIAEAILVFPIPGGP